MIRSIEYLPLEVIASVTSYLTIKEARELSYTCWFFSNYFANQTSVKDIKELKVKVRTDRSFNELSKRVELNRNRYLFEKIYNSISEIEEALQQRPNLFLLRDTNNNTLFHWFSKIDSKIELSQVFELIDRYTGNYDIHAINDFGFNCLTLALLFNRTIKHIITLLDRNANIDCAFNINFRTPEWMLPVSYVQNQNQPDLEYTVDTEIGIDDYRTIFSEIGNFFLWNTNSKDRNLNQEKLIKFIKKIPNNLIDIEIPLDLGPHLPDDEQKYTLVPIAVVAQNLTALRLLKEKGANFERHIKESLIVSIQKSNAELFFVLIGDSNECPILGDSFFSLFHRCNNDKILRFFLDHPKQSDEFKFFIKELNLLLTQRPTLKAKVIFLKEKCKFSPMAILFILKNYFTRESLRKKEFSQIENP